jgi:hypothetical protein|nr:MAG TPA: hypothetical protein [Caudoviricetes sp.]
MKKQDKSDQSFITAEQFIEKKDQQAKRDHFVRRIQLERDLSRTANAASKMAACIEALVGGDRKVLELSVSSYASTSSELVRIFSQLSEFYRTEAKDAVK